MKLDELERKSILILGFGTEGQATYEFLRRKWPTKPLTLADRRTLGEFPQELARRLQQDPVSSLNLGPGYLDSLVPGNCEVIIKTPGIPASTDQIARARKSGCLLTSHSQIFLSNYPRDKIIGVTGTKGKSTTTSLIYQILKRGGLPAELVGNIGQPPLAKLMDVSVDTYFVHEFSSHQLAEVESSPHIAVLLNIVPEHLDYYSTFDEYVAAKENITRFQEPDDFLVFNPAYPIPNAIAQRTKAALRPFNPEDAQRILKAGDVQLPGKFNLENVMAAVTAASLCGVERAAMSRLSSSGVMKEIWISPNSAAGFPGTSGRSSSFLRRGNGSGRPSNCTRRIRRFRRLFLSRAWNWQSPWLTNEPNPAGYAFCRRPRQVSAYSRITESVVTRSRLLSSCSQIPEIFDEGRTKPECPTPRCSHSHPLCVATHIAK